MKKVSMILTLVIALFVIPSSLAGTSEVTWTNPDKYRDVDAGEGHRAKFKAQVFAEFEKHFSKLASTLPDGQRLKVEVTDVDLAGDVNHGGIRRIRVVKELFFPRIKFNYQLLDSTGQEIKAGDINLKDMNFMFGTTLRYNNALLSYEKRMLDNWFNETFIK